MDKVSDSENSASPTTPLKDAGSRVWMFYVPERKANALAASVKPGAASVNWLCDVDLPAELGRNDRVWLLHALKPHQQGRCYRGFPFHDLSLPRPGVLKRVIKGRITGRRGKELRFVIESDECDVPIDKSWTRQHLAALQGVIRRPSTPMSPENVVPAKAHPTASPLKIDATTGSECVTVVSFEAFPSAEIRILEKIAPSDADDDDLLGPQVFLVACARYPKSVVMKRLPLSSGNSAQTGRFIPTKEDILREVAVHKSFDHPNITKVLDVFSNPGNGKQQPSICILMEQMQMSLLDWIDTMSMQDSGSSIQALPTERIVAILQGVASALEYIHSKGLLYRDVKTGNVLLSFSSDARDLIVKLSDFGTTMRPPKRGSYPGKYHTIGEFFYLAPECFLQQSREDSIIQAWSDIWGFGCLVGELLTKMFPWNWVYGEIAESQGLDPEYDAQELDEWARHEIISCIMDEAATAGPFRVEDVLNANDGQVKALWNLHKQCCIYDWEDRCSIAEIVKELGELARL